MNTPTILRGIPPTEFSGSGYGYGSGSGYGDGYGYGDVDGYGDGSGSGYGDGYGYGSVDGSGSGYGYGYGYGDGYGYGYGDGDGDGDGDGYVDGDGDGYGYGYGDGYGYGYGYGYGDGDGDGYWTIVAGKILADMDRSADESIAFWWSDKNGLPANGGSSKEAAKPGLIHRESGKLMICEAGALHATLSPEKWKGERLWLVALSGDVARAGDKLAAKTREIICEVK